MPFGQFAPADLAVDLGSRYTRVYVKGKGIVINEASVVAVNQERGGRVVAVGDDAEEIAGRSDSRYRLLRPVAQGKITDLETTQLMIQYFINKAIGSVRLKPRAIALRPIGTSRMEESVLRRTVESIGCRQQVIVDSIIAAGQGAGLPVYEPQGSFIADIGAGKTEIALVSMGGIVLSHTVPTGGNRIDQEIAAHIRREYDMAIVERAAEQIKCDLIDVRPEENAERKIVVRGRDIATGMPTTSEVGLEGVCGAICRVLDEIMDAMKWALARIPPELCSDVLKGGITLCGGTSRLPKLQELITAAFGVPASAAREAGECAVLGAGYLADHFELYGEETEKSKG